MLDGDEARLAEIARLQQEQRELAAKLRSLRLRSSGHPEAAVMNGVFIGQDRIGTVAKFIGNPRSQRWVAWSVVCAANEENRRCFLRRCDAVAWLEAEFRKGAARG